MGTALVVVISILVVLVATVLLRYYIAIPQRMKSHSKRINEYFCNAARVYAFTGSQDARIAAVTAAKVAAGAQRNSMLAYLRGMASDLKQISESEPDPRPLQDQFVKEPLAEFRKGMVAGIQDLFVERFVEAAEELEKDISVKDWTIADIRVQKEELGKVNPDYLNALNKADPSVFARKLPHLFK